MFAQLPIKERVGYVAVACLMLGGMAYVGAAQMRQPAPIVFEGRGPQTAQQEATDATTEATPTEVVVHVVGAVKKPGVYRLLPGARCIDAVELAGGALGDADLEQVNLAAKLQDGLQLYIPPKVKGAAAARRGSSSRRSETVPPMRVSVTPEPEIAIPYRAVDAQAVLSETPEPKQEPSEVSGVVSLNTATKSQLESLPGVGPATAQKIIDYRTSKGGFRSIDELLAVKGIGPKKLESMRPHLRL